MVKLIKNHPASKRGGVDKIFAVDYLIFTVVSLTAMPVRAWLQFILFSHRALPVFTGRCPVLGAHALSGL